MKLNAKVAILFMYDKPDASTNIEAPSVSINQNSSVASHFLDHVNERGCQHTVTEDSVRLLKEESQ
jgi:hypothetical protein